MCRSLQLQRLEFSAFRGAVRPTQIRFDPASRITLIYGENGTGKSTIADAIDFVCNNDLGSVRLRSGTRASHVVSSTAAARDLRVKLATGDTTWEASLQGQKAVTTPGDAPRAFVLRRADITRIMEATDSQRYKSLQEFITVPQIEKAENALRTAYRTAASEVEQAIQQKGAAEQTLQEIWVAEGSHGDSFVSWAREVVQQPKAAVESGIKQERALLATLDIAVAADQRVQTTAVQLSQARAEYGKLNEDFRRFRQGHANADLVETLEAASAYLEGHPEAEHCPVCAKPEAGQKLRAQVDAQLAQLQTVQRLRRELDEKLEEGKGISGAYTAARQAWQAAYADLSLQLLDAPYELTEAIEIADEVFDEKVGGEAEAAIHTTLHALSDRRVWLAERIERSEKRLGQQSALAAHLATIDRFADSLVDAYTVSQRLEDMQVVVEEERKRYVEAMVDQISSTVSDLYRRIHPDEPLGNPSFGLKDKTRASLTLNSTFGQHENVPPSAYYSESHLDTLGICVYLALAKQAGNAIVVLDDVLVSSDKSHMDRLIALLDAEVDNLGHVIITTHDRAWFERMRDRPEIQAQLVELQAWDLQRGMSVA